MTVEVLRTRAEKWPVSESTPEGVAALLFRSRQMFIDGYYTYKNFMDAATRSLQAVEAALRVRFDARSKISFAQLIDRAKEEGVIGEDLREIFHFGRIFRNSQIHATSLSVLPPVMSAQIIGASHKLVAEIFVSKA